MFFYDFRFCFENRKLNIWCMYGGEVEWKSWFIVFSGYYVNVVNDGVVGFFCVVVKVFAVFSRRSVWFVFVKINFGVWF